jgi:hypothetical protein
LRLSQLLDEPLEALSPTELDEEIEVLEKAVAFRLQHKRAKERLARLSAFLNLSDAAFDEVVATGARCLG